VFIRAPIVERTGPEVEVLATVAGIDGTERAVVCRQGNIVVAAFHPELADDGRLHQLFVDMVKLFVDMVSGAPQRAAP
jgi:5'-phosphate synthase pdxT subunit